MSDIVERAEERLSVSRLGKSSHRETDKDLGVIADLLAEVKQLEGEVFAWRMRNHELADEVKRLTPRVIETESELREFRIGTLIRDPRGRVWQRILGDEWVALGRLSAPDHVPLPARLLYAPEGGDL